MSGPSDQVLRVFIRESNRIEGIYRAVRASELTATREFLHLSAPAVADVENLVAVYAPGHLLRREPHLNVRVGSHIAPQGGPEIEAELAGMMARLADADPWLLHIDYERLHPFTDGNGRSGRALWAWQMVRRLEGLSLGFLHRFYYQTLERIGRR